MGLRCRSEAPFLVIKRRRSSRDRLVGSISCNLPPCLRAVNGNEAWQEAIRVSRLFALVTFLFRKLYAGERLIPNGTDA